MCCAHRHDIPERSRVSSIRAMIWMTAPCGQGINSTELRFLWTSRLVFFLNRAKVFVVSFSNKVDLFILFPRMFYPLNGWFQDLHVRVSGTRH